jgi:hypothetical protein
MLRFSSSMSIDMEQHDLHPEPVSHPILTFKPSYTI